MEASDAGSQQQVWRVWADTGGTFTDCLGVAPGRGGGGLRRAKVLSAGVLRAALARGGERVLFVREQWAGGEGGPLPRDFVAGLPLRPAAGAAAATNTPPAMIVRYEPADAPGGDSRVEIDRPFPAGSDIAPGALLEVAWPAEAPVVGAHLLTRTPFGAPLPPMALRVATTRGTNALLTRRGAPPVLFVTRGFADLLAIGTQQRPDLFALDIAKPEPLYGAVVEVEERLAADGSVLRALDESALRAAARALRDRGFDTAAVALLHADRNDAHEARVAELLRGAGFSHVSRSAELAPFIKVLPRAQTAVVNAYLAPVIDAYVGGLTAAAGTLHLMTSAGGLVGAGAFRPKDSLLSGPAGGVVGAARAARLSGHPRLIAFDMGGTSTDVARCDVDQGYDYVFEHRVGDAHLVAPALAIESVAAGGGSVCFVERKGLRVGPESAGASPGPACYGAGGPLTVTDVNLLLGRLDPSRFEIPIDRAAAEAGADALLAALERETGERMTREALLAGFLDVANERMADAIRTVSVRRGYDPAEHALVAFGGAGGQHACAVAGRLGIPTVLVPRDAGLLSALGIGHASVERFAERQVLAPATAETEAAVGQFFAELAEEAVAAVAAEGVPRGSGIGVRRRIAALRLAGQESALEVEFVPGGTPLAELFAARFAAVFGYRPEPTRPVEVVSLRVVAGSDEGGVGGDAPGGSPDSPPFSRAAGGGGEVRYARAFFGGAWRDVPVVARESLRPDSPPVVGPALIAERHCATVVEPGWTAATDATGALVLTSPPGYSPGAREERPSLSAIDRELFTARFTSLAEEMGEMLRRTALSVNVKERLDFSCALLGPGGDLVASAAHIPVHLGALGLCVRTLRERVPLAPGDVIVTNHPAFGGSHLPDVTVVTPVHDDAGVLLGYAASRAHHAEIGGTRPGSMPPGATRLAEEGVVIPPTHLVRAGVPDRDAVTRLLTGGPYPTRSLADNLADLEAAVAANRRGADALRALAAAHGAERVHTAMEALAARADTLLGEALARRAPGRREAADALDDGSPLRVAVMLEGDGGGATIDFTGTGTTHPGNLNATPAIVRSAALYVLRLLVNEPLPLNEGLLRRVRLVLPPGSLLSPDFDPDDPANCPAVVGGNTETSQRVVDLLLEALGLAANSQGTMNNVLFGNAAFGYYETVCGGAGATPSAAGASAVHTHMTNTRITDPEVLERRCPVRVERFAVRRGSGGAGRHPGGDGAVREIAFLSPMSLSVLTQHRRSGPRGAEGGGDGAPGRQTVTRADGSVTPLGSVDGCEVMPGDRLLLETPGGGGWGNPTD